MQTEPSSSATGRPESLMVVGLGASAGGIKALQTFFSKVSSPTGVAYVVILHLSPDHASRLAEVLQSSTGLPVRRVTGEVAIEPDVVYVIAPNTSLRVGDGKLIVSELQRQEERRAPVDVFFRTLADAYGPSAACVILSGTGPNGSNGIKRVKESGGLVLAQAPEEAEYTDMPRNAIATGLVDAVLPASEMAARIVAYRRQRFQSPAVGPLPDVEAANSALQRILAIVRARTGQDFSQYKLGTVLRRIERRQSLHELPDLHAYAGFIQSHPDEAAALRQELLISVTHFFRDAQAFAALERTVIPAILHRKRGNDQVRIWSVGCATGEEAYSLAILLAEGAAGLPNTPMLQVFASDLDERAIAVAREGFYTEADVADLAPERLRRFFIREGRGFRVRRELRETVLFAHHNALKDPPFSHLDLISCRNLLIYLNRSVQERLLQTFNFALNPGGFLFLFLGTSETTEGAGELFAALDKSASIYESRAVLSRPVIPRRDVLTLPELPARPADRSAQQPPFERLLPGELHLQLIEQYAPPSVLATDEQQIVHMSERAGRYLQVPAGEPSRDLLKHVRPELRVELRSALYQASKDRQSVEVRDVPITVDGEAKAVTLRVRPMLHHEGPPRGYFLVLFEEGPPNVERSVELVSRVEPDVARQLEDELTRVKSQLRSTVEQFERQVEEARAASEELQASNEELRSAAEELETSKEELQSVNEELTTVNQELKIKVEELTVTNNDFQNLINSTEIGTIFLDRALRVKFSTPRARDVFNLLPLDIGRPLSDITSNLAFDGLQRDVEQVLDRLQPVESEVQTHEGRWYLMRVMPYRTSDERIEGVVITFQDITDRRRAERQMQATQERLRLFVDSLEDYAVFTIAPDGTINSWNTGAERMFGWSEPEILGQPFDVVFSSDDRAAGVPRRELEQARGNGRAADERWHVRKDGTALYCGGVTSALQAGEAGFAKIARDLTRQQQASRELQRAQSELEDRIRERTAQLEAQVGERTRAEERIVRLVRQLVTAQEDERRRIARDLHDQLGQLLTALRLSLERAGQPAAGGPDQSELAAAMRIVSEISDELDSLSWELRPTALDDLGLPAALSRYVGTWSEHHQVAAQFRSSGLDHTRLPAEIETTYYRVAQEALNNIAKHAHAARVDVILERRDGVVTMVIEDDGVGFESAETEPAVRGFGLVGMRERAALSHCELHVESTPGKGTSVFLRRPLPSEEV